MLAVVNSLWIGNRLGPVHAGCLRSFLRNGHRVVLHVFDRPEDVPEGVELFDAQRLMARSEIVAHEKTGSLALASDIYRYRILKAGLGIYVDCDVYSLRPIRQEEFLFGWESDKTINGAVLGLPSQHPALDELVTASSDPHFIPWWYRRTKRRLLHLRKAMRLPVPVSRHRWGAIGPQLLTNVTRRHEIAASAKPIDVFYPISYQHTNLLFDRGLSWPDIATNRTLGVHLSASVISGREIVRGSLLDAVVTL
jgi:hypothetical protein